MLHTASGWVVEKLTCKKPWVVYKKVLKILQCADFLASQKPRSGHPQRLFKLWDPICMWLAVHCGKGWGVGWMVHVVCLSTKRRGGQYCCHPKGWFVITPMARAFNWTRWGSMWTLVAKNGQTEEALTFSKSTICHPNVTFSHWGQTHKVDDDEDKE